MATESATMRRQWSLKLVFLAGFIVGAASLFEYDLAEGRAMWAWVIYWAVQVILLGVVAWLAGLGPWQRTAKVFALLIVAWNIGWFVTFLVAFMTTGGEAG